MTRPQVNWVLVPDAPVLTTEEELARRYPKPTPESPESLASMKEKADAQPPSENDIGLYACALIEAGDLRGALQYVARLTELVPTSKVAEAIKLYIVERNRCADESAMLRARVAHSKRLYKAAHEDHLARMSPSQRHSEQRLLAARASGAEELLEEARKQIESNASDIRSRYVLDADRKREWNPRTIWNNFKLTHALKKLERSGGIEAVAHRLPILIAENSSVRSLYTVGIELYLAQNRFAEALYLTIQARDRFPRIAYYRICEEALHGIVSAVTVERKEAKKQELESRLTALRLALLRK